MGPLGIPAMSYTLVCAGLALTLAGGALLCWPPPALVLDSGLPLYYVAACLTLGVALTLVGTLGAFVGFPCVYKAGL
jgi:uncharacterized membrane protein YhhN